MTAKDLLNIHRQALQLAPYQDSEGTYWTKGEWKL